MNRALLALALLALAAPSLAADFPPPFPPPLPVKVQPAEAGLAKPAPTTAPAPREPQPRVQGDTVDDPFVIGSLPFTATGNTCSYNDDYEYACPWSAIAPDVVYQFICAADEAIDIDLCLSAYDTKVFVFQNTVGNVIACNDDYCNYQSYLDDVPFAAGNTYYIVVDGYGDSCGSYELDVTGSGPPPPLGDVAANPYLVGSLPFSASGTTCGFADDYDESCPATSTSPDVVYLYQSAASVPVDIDLCGSAYDTKVFVYQGAIGNLIACNDDYCALQSQLSAVPFVAGQAYYIVVDGAAGDCGDYDLQISVGPLPPGDAIEDALVIDALPFTGVGNSCIYTDNYDEVCPYAGSTAPDLVYEYLCTTDLAVDLDLCDSSYDTKLYVYEDAVGNLVACNDDACSGPNYSYPYLSRLMGVPLYAGHTYYIIVDGYGSNCGDYVLRIAEGVPCLECPPDAVQEGEPDCYYGYVDAYNGGCFADPAVFQVLAPSCDGNIVCGSTGFADNYDYDWYEFVPPATHSYRMTIRAELNTLLYLLDGTAGCGAWEVLNSIPSGECQDSWMEHELVAGRTYWLVTVSDAACGTEYILSLEYAFSQPEPGEYGDAPECALAYPGLGVMGAFPTCVNVGPVGFVTHGPVGWAWFGPGIDFEPEGNAGSCPVFNPNLYDQDECQGGADAGLLMPDAYTIAGPVGSEGVVPCIGGGQVQLGDACNTAIWGVDIDILVTNTFTVPFFVNVLADWDQGGFWAGSATCPGGPAPEHVLVDFLIPPGFSGPLSALGPPAFLIGPNSGDVWMRFTISEIPVGTSDWNGEGAFEDGETEDYIIQVGNLAACCFPNGDCMMLAQGDCDAAGGIGWGLGTTCTPNPCPQPPTGACCVGEVCQVLTEADCVAQSGTYQGDGTGCDPNPCLPPAPTGACCLEGYVCQIMTEADCIAGSGTYQGDGTGCDPNPCLPIEPWEDVVLAGFDDFERSFAADYQGWILQLVERWLEPAGPALVLDYLPFAPEQWTDATQYPYLPGSDAAGNGEGSFQVGLRLEGDDDAVTGHQWFDAVIVQSEDWYTHNQSWPAGYEQHPDYTGSWPFGHYGSIGPVTGDELRLRVYSPGFHHPSDMVEGTMFTKSGASWTWVETGFAGIEHGWNILRFPVSSIHDANDLREFGLKLGSHHFVWDDLYVDNVTLGDTPYPSRYVFMTPDVAFFSETPGYDTKTVSIYYDDGGGATPLMRGFTLEIAYPSGCAAVTDVQQGDLLLGPGDPTTFQFTDDGAGTLTIDWLILGVTNGAGGVGKLATVTFTGASDILDCCDAVTFNVGECRFRDPNNVPITNMVYVGGEVSHDITPPIAAVLGSPTHTAGVPSNADDLKVTWATTQDPDLGLYHCPVGMRGYYLALDQNPSGSPDPQGTYAWFTPWSPDSTGYATWFTDLAEGTWYVHIIGYDWLWNASTVGHFGPITIDTTAPGLVTGFDADVTDEADRSVDLMWVNPGDADLVGVEVYRMGTAGTLGSTYPEYDDDPNWAVPAWPATQAAAVAAGWTLVGQFPGTNHVDLPVARDYYYYIAFAYDGAGNYGGADAGSRDATLSYWLGDFNGTANPTYFVDIQDVLVISAAYNTVQGDPSYNAVCDIGPTVDWGRKSLPTTDNEVEFEDMIILALNYENAQGALMASPPSECTGRMTARLEQSLSNDLLEVRVMLAENPGCLKGASVELTYGSGLEFLDAAQGGLWSGVENYFIDSRDGGTVLLDAFALQGAVSGNGCHAIVRFRATDAAGTPSLRITGFRARSTSNADIAGESLSAEVTDLPLPATHALFSARPNPTVRGATIGFALASEERIAIRIYDAGGRLVRTLVDEPRPAGLAQVSWDGLRADGSTAGPGIYFYRMQAGDYLSSRKLTVLR